MTTVEPQGNHALGNLFEKEKSCGNTKLSFGESDMWIRLLLFCREVMVVREIGLLFPFCPLKCYGRHLRMSSVAVRRRRKLLRLMYQMICLAFIMSKPDIILHQC